MKKIIMLLLIAFTLMSSTPKEQYGRYIIFTNETYRAVAIDVYHYEDTDWVLIGYLYIPSQSSKTIKTDNLQWNEYGYTKNGDVYITQIFNKHVRVY